MMTSILLKILAGLVTKLMTETFVARFIIHLLQPLVASTKNQVDDAVVNDLAAALGVAVSKDLETPTS